MPCCACGLQDRPRPRRLRRLVEVLHVEEEERLAPAVDRARESTIGPPTPPAVLVDDDLVAIEAVHLVEAVVGVERRVAEVVVDAAVELVRARPGDERDLHRAGAGAVGAGRRRRDRDFFDRIEARRDHREEAVARLQVVAVADAVDRDVDGVLRQADDRRPARPAGRLDAGQERRRSRACCARRAAGSLICSAVIVDVTAVVCVCTSSLRA